MFNFAETFEKFAQVGLPSPATPAQLYAAKKSEKELKELMLSDSPGAYATAIAGGIVGGMGIPVMLGLTPLLGDVKRVTGMVGKYQDQVYLSEALEKLHQFKPDDAKAVAAVLTNQNKKITNEVADRLTTARMMLAETAAQGPIDGVDERARAAIVADAETAADRIAKTKGREHWAKQYPGQPFNYVYSKFKELPLEEQLRHLRSPSYLGDANVQGYFRSLPEFRGTVTPAFSLAETKVLTDLGKKLYKDRTGKVLTENGVLIRLVSKQLANSVKSGVPFGVIAGIAGGVSQYRRAQEKKELIRPRVVSPFGGPRD